ncbi:M67 family metallopeptidase [Halomicronema sp. CCY15110]|uniref:M67 family metallopeptidase n=1 Tax=Halomicronema sp. CCY15110 TaxID=2767773 RepID=UPI00194EFB2B|nr:M67 family metallopeptidase [Halomicronema sp. CCY15110]
MTLILQPEQIQVMHTEAAQSYPEECCGLLLGVYDARQELARVTEVLPIKNTWTEAVNPFAEDDRSLPSPSKRNRFWIDPQILLHAQRDCRDRGWSIVGIYHSHPDHPAVPSERDRQLAWSGYSYPILSITAEGDVAMQSWRLNGHDHFEVETIQAAPLDEK